jgi:single-strand DNA-binding protein
MNKVILMGNLTRDPEVSYTRESNTAIARFSIAVGRRYKRDGEPEADFFDCTAWGKTAEFVEKYFHKGSRMVLCGRLENNNYTNKNGEKVYSIRIQVEEVEFGERKQSGTNDGTTPPPANDDDDFVNIDPKAAGDIPFFMNQ